MSMDRKPSSASSTAGNEEDYPKSRGLVKAASKKAVSFNTRDKTGGVACGGSRGGGQAGQ